MLYTTQMKSDGSVSARVIRNNYSAPLIWKLKNWLRWSFLWPFFTYHVAKQFSAITHIITVTGRLSATHIDANGKRTKFGWLAHGVVTTAFVNFLVDQMQTETSEFGDFKFHDSGVGTTAAVVGDTDIETTDGVARATGTQLEGASSNIYKSVGTITYTSTLAITEHGLFSIVTGGVLLDRHVFAAINVENTDSIVFTYEYTANAGG